jgi:maltooligosyltrehalose trehalohydrolase
MSAFGALPCDRGVRFRVWAPRVRDLELVLHDGRAEGTYRPDRDAEGTFDILLEDARAGDRYGYRLDGGELRPDPASRFQPEGVHGPSQVVDPYAFEWTDARWSGAPADLVVYELHVGTFTPEGSFRAAAERLPYLRDLGITAIELMPVADFPGLRNWGYDGVCLYAPSRAYGRPDDLRGLVDEAHRLGLAVILDVVYNHLGPDGAYLPAFNPEYLSERHGTPWGRAINLDGPGAHMVRRFIIDNARHWIGEYHLDGLRLDATHALIDDSPVTFVAELAAEVRAAAGRPIVIHAEDHRNLAAMIDDAERGGWGLDGVWADDFHHAMRRYLAGDSHGYYADYAGTTSEIAQALREGWLLSGQPTRTGRPRGTDPSAVPMSRCIACLQNHDQIGNRALGDRLTDAVAPESWRAASTVLLTSPLTPLLFMGQEWAASTPFQFFTDLPEYVGRLVTEGRRMEFAAFPGFSDPTARGRIPDPQAVSTFAASRLVWEERDAPPHGKVLALYRALLALRREHPPLGSSRAFLGEAYAPDRDTVIVRREDGQDAYWVAARLRTGGVVDLGPCARASGEQRWETILTTEDPGFADNPAPPGVEAGPDGPRVRFSRAGAIVMRQSRGRRHV